MKKLFTALVANAASGFGGTGIDDSGADYGSSTRTALNKCNSIKSQKGVTLIEYALIGVLVSIVAILLLTQAGQQVQVLFTRVVNDLTTVAGS